MAVLTQAPSPEGSAVKPPPAAAPPVRTRATSIVFAAGDHALGLRSCEPEAHQQGLPTSFIK
jgi:hypothetical protein